ARGGRIDILAEHRDGEVVIEVRDDGPGIAPEHADRLFQPYFTTKKHGTGLGLFVTRKLVGDHGGRIEHVAGPGHGTIFRVYLPPGLGLAASRPARAEPAALGGGP